MKDRIKMSKIGFFLICLFFGIFLFAAAISVYFDGIFAYAANLSPDYAVSFSGWEKSIFDKNVIHDLRISSRKHNIGLSADRADVYMDIKRLLREKCISMEVFLSGVKMSYFNNGSERDFSDKSMYGLFTGSDQSFNYVRFLIYRDDAEFNISEIKADSQNIKVLGNCSFSEEGRNAEIDIRISISSSLAKGLDQKVRDSVLFQEDTGWYSTIINYKGSTELLRALYHFSEKK